MLADEEQRCKDEADKIISVFKGRSKLLEECHEKKQHSLNIYTYLKAADVQQDLVNRLLLEQSISQYAYQPSNKSYLKKIRLTTYKRFPLQAYPILQHIPEASEKLVDSKIKLYETIKHNEMMKDNVYRCMMEEEFIQALAFLR